MAPRVSRGKNKFSQAKLSEKGVQRKHKVFKEEKGDDELSWTHHRLINRPPVGKSSMGIVGQQLHDSIRNSNVLENSKSLDSIKLQILNGIVFYLTP